MPASAADGSCFAAGTAAHGSILSPCAGTSLASFDSAQMDQLEALLDCADPDLFDWFSDYGAPPPAHDHDVVCVLCPSLPTRPSCSGGRVSSCSPLMLLYTVISLTVFRGKTAPSADHY